MEAALGAWAERVLTALPPATGEPEALAIDVTTRRGRRTHGTPAVHLLSALRHRLGRTVWPQAITDQPHAIPVLEDVWRGLLLEGRASTVDAWLTPRAIAHHVVEGGGDDVMIVQGNEPQVPHEIRLVFHESTALAETLTACDTGDHGHGRREARRLTASTALMAYSHWPGVA